MYGSVWMGCLLKSSLYNSVKFEDVTRNSCGASMALLNKL